MPNKRKLEGRKKVKRESKTLHPMASFMGLPTTKELAGLQKRLKRIANCARPPRLSEAQARDGGRELRIADFKK